MAQTQFENSAKPGDLIEIFREPYEHWAIYIGGNEVVHLTTPTGDSGPFGNLLAALDCNTAQVRRQKIREVVGSHRFRINNLLDDKYEPRERYIIVREACMMVGQELPYSVATSNCEHFVTELRYGKPESRQVTTAAIIGGAAIGGVAIAVLGAALFASFFKDDNETGGERERKQKGRRHRK